mgnify:CR=1 FL=1
MRPASSIAEQNGLSAMFSVVVDEMKHEDPDEKSDDSPPFNLSALSSVVADIKRTIRNMPDALGFIIRCNEVRGRKRSGQDCIIST